MKKLAKQELLYHLLFWVFLVFAINIIFQVDIHKTVDVNGKPEEFIFRIRIMRILLIGLLFKICFAYLNVFVLLRKMLDGRITIRYLIVLVFTGILFFFLEKATVDYYYVIVNRITDGTVRIYLIKINVLLYVLVAAISLVYFFTREWMINQRNEARLKEEQLNTRLKLLNYQVNPHFLFNTLNNFYALAQESRNIALAEGISGLSHLMRYTLHDVSTNTVPLEKEIEYLKEYISLYRLRIDPSDDIRISFDVSGSLGDKMIMPMIFIPLVENAFKHGVNFKRPSFVAIHLHSANEELQFIISNSNFAQLNRSSVSLSGVGLANLKERLDLMYPGKYTLDISQTADQFNVELKIKN